MVGLAGCGSGEAKDEAPKARAEGLIGIALPTTVAARWITDGDNLVYEFEKRGYTTRLDYADDNASTQIAQIQEMIDSGARALVIGAVNSTALTDVLSKARAQNIKVLAYDRLIRDTADVDYYATFDNRRVGVLQGTYLVDALGLASGSSSATIELFAGAADDNNSKMFFDGAMSVLQPYLTNGRLSVRSGQKSFQAVATKGWSSAVAAQRMTGILEENYESATLDAVLSPNDDLSRGILQAVKAAGQKAPTITGQDADIDSVKLIAAGQQGQTVFKDTRKLAEVAATMVNTLITGGTPEVNDTSQYNNGVKTVPTYLLQPESVVKSNYEKVLVGSGFYSDQQLKG